MRPILWHLDRMRLLQAAGLLALTLTFGGCFQSTTILRVKADRSGTIEQQSVLSTAAIGQLKELARQFGGGTQQAPIDPLSEDQARALATSLGPGVTYVSSTPIVTDAMEGRDSLYAFSDINALRISNRPPAPGGVNIRADSLGPTQTITFSLEPQANGHQLLRIRMPEMKQLPGLPVQLPGTASPRTGDQAQAQGPTPEQIEMAKRMFAGMRMTIAVEPEGRVVATSSPYMDGDRVTLFDLDFDQLVANPDSLKALQEAQTPEAVQAVVRTIPGLKFTLAREVTIEFAPGTK